MDTAATAQLRGDARPLPYAPCGPSSLQSDCLTLKKDTDAADYGALRAAMTTMNIGAEAADGVFQTLSGLLHLGCVARPSLSGHSLHLGPRYLQEHYICPCSRRPLLVCVGGCAGSVGCVLAAGPA